MCIKLDGLDTSAKTFYRLHRRDVCVHLMVSLCFIIIGNALTHITIFHSNWLQGKCEFREAFHINHPHYVGQTPTKLSESSKLSLLNLDIFHYQRRLAKDLRKATTK